MPGLGLAGPGEKPEPATLIGGGFIIALLAGNALISLRENVAGDRHHGDSMIAYIDIEHISLEPG
ncbi:MAG: hypothetical protein H6651_17835 [Ardenticatenales bacterium]|nr:hypothetical protein [Ardenticatenales bacterium]